MTRTHLRRAGFRAHSPTEFGFVVRNSMQCLNKLTPKSKFTGPSMMLRETDMIETPWTDPQQLCHHAACRSMQHLHKPTLYRKLMAPRRVWHAVVKPILGNRGNRHLLILAWRSSASSRDASHSDQSLPFHYDPQRWRPLNSRNQHLPSLSQ
jgi:hypothetical protein